MFVFHQFLQWSKNISQIRGRMRFSMQHFQKYKRSCTNLLKIPLDESKTFINSLEAVLFDGDGVLWLNDCVIPMSECVFNLLTVQGKKTFICTNNSTRTRESLMKKACGLDFMVNVDSILTSSHAVAEYLKEQNFKKRAYVIGREGIIQELAMVGIKHCDIGPYNMNGTIKDLIDTINLDTNIGAVIVGFDEYFSFPKLTKACAYLMNPQCLLLATNLDEKYPAGKMILPATGCFVRAVETCAERSATVIGKPNVTICDKLLKNSLIKSHSTLMVGDRGNTDILLGHNCGFYTLLVGSGINSLDDVERWRQSKDESLHNQIPDFYLPKLADLIQILN